MSTKKKLLEAAAGNAGEAVYVDDVFSTYLYTGTNATQAVVNGLDLAGEGGLIWTKARTSDPNELDHQLMDSEQGAFRYVLESNTTNARFDYGGSIVTPNSDGFTLSSASRVNQNGYPYVSWSFRKQPGFFDVVTYTGNGTAGRTISHNLGSVPGMVIVKRTDSTSDWTVWHKGATGNGFLQTNDAWQTSYTRITAPDSTAFTVSDSTMVNGLNGEYVAYLFAHDAQEFGTDSDESIIKCGSVSYTSGTPVYVDLGWEAQWVLIKQSNGTDSWYLVDTMRGMDVSGTGGKYLTSNSSSAEGDGAFAGADANGFILDPGTALLASGTFIYVAIRRPHKPAEEFAATDLFGMDSETPPSGNVGSWSAGFVTDMALKLEEALANHDINSRLTGTEVLYTDGTYAGSAASISKWDYQKGFGDAGTNSIHKKALFRRAPGFFDVVAYEGDGNSTTTVSHNLGVAPQLIMAKPRSASGSWLVVSAGPSGTMSDCSTGWSLNTDNAALVTGLNYSAYHTDEVFTPYRNISWDGSNGHQAGVDYIAYLFASVPGISKVGSYSGTGNDLNVDCGFSSGARFVLVKRTDSTGDWYVWNYLFGIVAGNDPYSLLNTSAAPVTNTDYIDPLSSGFTVTSSAPAALNASGGTYLFLAIA
jgi:hypothetical protein